MNMFAEFRLKIIPGSAKTVTPISLKIPKMGVSQKMTNFSFSRNYSGRDVYLAESTSLEDVNSEK